MHGALFMTRHLVAALSLFTLIGCSSDEGEPDNFHFFVETFAVEPGTEIQDCYFFEVPDLNDGQPVWVDQIHFSLREGSHHTNVFRVNTIVSLDGAPGSVVKGGECWNPANWADWPLVVNSQASDPQASYVNWTLPEGVAHKFMPGEKLMVQTHYVNGAEQATPDGGSFTIYFYKSAVTNPIELGTMFVVNKGVRICQSTPPPVFNRHCTVPGDDVRIAAVNGHFHSRGTRFNAYSWAGGAADAPGGMFYESTSWDEPPMALNLDMPVPQGGGVWWSCEYQWKEPPVGCDVLNMNDPMQENDCCYTFGGKVESNEHCNLFLYYWPKIEDMSQVTCE